MRRILPAGLIAICLGAGGCGGEPLERSVPQAPARMTLRSPDFADGGPLPERVTCEGRGDTPALQWSGVPRGTAELLLVMVDRDGPKGPLLHWALLDLPPTTGDLKAGVGRPETRLGENSFGRARFQAPCPPEGESAHRYQFVIYALSGPSGLRQAASPSDVLEAAGRLGKAEGLLTGTFAR